MELLHLPEISGIYLLKNKINNKIYIGQSINVRKRVEYHLLKAKHGTMLYNSILLHGAENFESSLLESCSREDLDEREEYWIKFFDSTNKDLGYNICSKGTSRRGLKHNEEARRKISLAMQKRVNSPEYSAWRSKTTKKLFLDKQFRQNHSNGQKRRFADPEQNERHCSIMKERYSNPEFVKKMQESTWSKKCKKVLAINIETGEKVIYPSIAKTAKEMNCSESRISRAVRQNKEFNGFLWSLSQ